MKNRLNTQILFQLNSVKFIKKLTKIKFGIYLTFASDSKYSIENKFIIKFQIWVIVQLILTFHNLLLDFNYLSIRLGLFKI